MSELDAADPWQALIEAEPAPVAYVDEPGLDRVARCFADMVDLKSHYTFGHSTQVAHFAEAAARTLGFAEHDVVAVRRRRSCTTWAGWASPAASGRRPGHSPAPSGSRSGCTPTRPNGSWRARRS